MMLENGVHVEQASDLSSKYSKRRRNGRKNGGAKIWAAACDDLYGPNDWSEVFAPERLVWARLEGGFWWPGFVASLENLPVSVLRQKQAGWICVNFYGKQNVSSAQNFAWFRPNDLVLYEDNLDDFCEQAISETCDAGNFKAAVVEIQEAYKLHCSKVDKTHETLANVVERMGKTPVAVSFSSDKLVSPTSVDKQSHTNREEKRKRKSSQESLDKKEPRESGDDTDEISKKRVLKLKITRPLAPHQKSGTERKTKADSPLSKKLGPDGSYFECVVCDSGGNLLCCDLCPGVYHLECLNPPLKRTPPGKWLCPICREQSDTLNDSIKAKAGKNTETSENANCNEAENEKEAPTCDRHNLFSERMHKRSREEMIKAKAGKNVETCQKVEAENEKEASNSNRHNVCSEKMHKRSRDENIKAKAGKDTETSEKANCNEVENGKEAPNSDKHDVFSEKMHKRRDEMIKRFRKKPKLEETESVVVDKCPPCGLNKQSSEISLDNSSPFNEPSYLCEEDEALDSAPTDKKLPVCDNCGDGGALVKCDRCSKSFHLTCLDTPHKKTHKSRWICPLCIALDAKKRKDDQLIVPVGLPEVDRIVGCRMQPVVDCSKNPCDELKVLPSLQPVKNSLLLEESQKVCDASASASENGGVTVPQESSSKTLADGLGPAQPDAPARKDGLCAGETVQQEEGEKGNAPSKSCLKDEKVPERKDATEGKLTASESTCELEYLVKWVGKSHVHNEWVSESRLKSLAKRKLENYKAKHGIYTKNLVDEKWTQPQKVIARRKVQGDVDEVLVKWSALPYDECTWERLNDSISGLPALAAMFDRFENEAIASESRKFKEAQGEIENLMEQPPELRGGLLFPHQMEALNWLRKCWHKKKNVILADEMGLGKTISACAFLTSLHHEFKVRGPCLVLVPLSTMPNWLAEFSLWAPDLNVIEYHGSVKARAVIRQYEWYPASSNLGGKKQRPYKFKVMLTNYETVLNDTPPLRSLPWEVLVVDEGHRLKNSGSKLFNLLNTFSFAHRVLMTGTPMQNNLGEMYNLLNFLQPEKFPSLTAFQDKFSTLSTAEQVDEIRKLVAPHMLRRLKKDAMQGIPPKAERVVLVELTSVQAEYYRALLTKNFQLLRHGTKSQQSMINIIMQLRKVCNHPYLIPGTEPEHGTGEFLHEMRIKASAKLSLLHAMLGCLKEEGHRVLIFSQMTKLLDILEDYLTFEFGQDSYERVDGSVPVGERQAAISRFNKDTSRFVFLLSTRSCGLGINLATADTVIIYDSDFNPHADIQAMNRAHRIGQSKKLLVYRLVVHGSVEERILQLAKKKLELDQLFASKSGSQKEIEDILQWGTEELFEEPKPSNELTVPNGEVPDEGDAKPKKKVGGLGDVYNDKCHEAGRLKIIWDDAAIKRLLDRSSVTPEAMEIESDMLGSIKAWDCNEQEQDAEEQNVDQSPKEAGPVASSDQKAGIVEENKWEKLLRIRWEKLQMEEEAVLGRGKRQRKVISYNECAVQKSKEASSESDEAEDAEPEYSPAGQALKQKLARLRARQKERIALRYAPPAGNAGGSFFISPFSIAPRYLFEALPESNGPTKFLEGSCALPDFPVDISCSNLAGRPDLYSRNFLSSIETKRNNDAFPMPEPVDEALMQKALASRLSKMVDGNVDNRMSVGDLNLFPGSMPPSLPDGVNHGPGLRQLLPALPSGLSRPPVASGFYSQGLPVHYENPSRSFLHGPFAQSQSSSLHQSDFVEGGGLQERKHEADKQRKLFNSDVPSFLDTCRMTEEMRPTKAVDLNKNIAAIPSPDNDFVLQTEMVHQRSETIPHPPQGEAQLLKLPSSETVFGASGNLRLTEVIPNLSMSLSLGLPTFCNPPALDTKYAGESKLYSSSVKYSLLDKDVSQNQPLGFDANSLTMRKTSARHGLEIDGNGSSLLREHGRASNSDPWTEDELDALWTGVRRHGRGNWINMLQDPRLCFSRYRTAKDLAERWEEEQAKLLGEPVPSSAEVKRESSSLSAVDIWNAGQELERFARPYKDRTSRKEKRSRSHRKDTLPNFEGKNLQLDGFPFIGRKSSARFDKGEVVGMKELPTSGSKLLPNFADFNFAARQERTGTLGLDLGSTSGIHFSASADRPELSSHVSKVLEKLQETQALYPPQAPPLPLLPSFNLNGDPGNWDFESRGMVPPLKNLISAAKLASNAQSSASMPQKAAKPSTLPHWLKEAFSVAPRPEPALSPHVAAVAQAVSVLHRSQKSLLAGWTHSWHPLVPPKELPRRKRRKRHRAQKQIELECSEQLSVGVAPLQSRLEPKSSPCDVSIPPQPDFAKFSSCSAFDIQSGTHFPPVHMPSFSFSRSLLEPLAFPPLPLVSSDTDFRPKCGRAAPFFPELSFASNLPSVPPFNYLDGHTPMDSKVLPQRPPELGSSSEKQEFPYQQPNFGLKQSRNSRRRQQVDTRPLKAELPPWLISGSSGAQLQTTAAAAAATAAVAIAGNGRADGAADSSSETHSDPEIRNKGEEVDGFLDVSSEGTVSDEEIQKP